MREIKFRSWNKGKNAMELDVYKECNNLMQYTGLKDKNGVEIYEGDIVKGKWWAYGKSHRHIGRVTYVMSAFKVRGIKQYYGMDDELNPTYEVIGNIHVNPELLNDEVS